MPIAVADQPSPPPIELRLCHGQRPWYESDASHGDWIWTYMECPVCHAMTESCEETETAERAWNAGEVTIPEFAKPK